MNIGKVYLICGVINLVLFICSITMPNVTIPCLICQFAVLIWMMVLGIKDDLKKADKKKGLAQKL